MAMPAPPLLLFSGCRVALVQSHGLPRTQVKALERLLSRQGARLSEVGSATHVICAAPSDEQLLHVPAGARCVSPAWLIESRKAGERLSEEEFEHVVSAGGASARHGCSAASSSCPIGALALPQQQAKRPPSRRARTAETLADTTGDAALGAEERGSAEEIKQPPAKRACTAETFVDMTGDAALSAEERAAAEETVRILQRVHFSGQHSSGTAPAAELPAPSELLPVCDDGGGDTGPETTNQSIARAFKELIACYTGRDEYRAKPAKRVLAVISGPQFGLAQHAKQFTLADARVLQGVGGKTLAKLEEVIRTGDLQRNRLNAADPKIAAEREMRCRIWGCGASTAAKWRQLGYTTAEAVRDAMDIDPRLALTANQRVGLRHLVDFERRMPREHVAEMGELVRRAASTVGDCELHLLGSYRRGAALCGDADCILFLPAGCRTPPKHVLARVLAALSESGAAEVSAEAIMSREADEALDGCATWSGAGKVEGWGWMRLDIKVYTLEVSISLTHDVRHANRAIGRLDVV